MPVPTTAIPSESLLCHSTAVEVCLCLVLYILCWRFEPHYLLSCRGSSVGRSLMPRARASRAESCGFESHPEQLFFFVLGAVELFAFVL